MPALMTSVELASRELEIQKAKDTAQQLERQLETDRAAQGERLRPLHEAISELKLLRRFIGKVESGLPTLRAAADERLEKLRSIIERDDNHPLTPADLIGLSQNFSHSIDVQNFLPDVSAWLADAKGRETKGLADVKALAKTLDAAELIDGL